jgi:hypothetical protein
MQASMLRQHGHSGLRRTIFGFWLKIKVSLMIAKAATSVFSLRKPRTSLFLLTLLRAYMYLSNGAIVMA